jgi:hypothetical protein
MNEIALVLESSVTRCGVSSLTKHGANPVLKLAAVTRVWT